MLPIGMTNEEEYRACNLWMGDVMHYMTREFIMMAFHMSGEHVVDVKLMTHKNTSMPCNYCFVEFPTIEAAQQAQLRLNGKPIPNSNPPSRFKLNHTIRGKDFAIEHSLFVGDLDHKVDDLMLYTVFHDKFPAAKTAKVVLDDQGKSRGFAFVRFTVRDEADRAMQEMKGFKIGERCVSVHSAARKSKKPDETLGEKFATSFQNFPSNFQQSGYDYQHEMQMQGVGGQIGEYPPYWDSKNDPQMNGPNAVPEVYPGTEPTPEEDDYQLVDPQVEVDVDKMNREFMARSEEWWEALEASRWHPLDNVYAAIGGGGQSLEAAA